MPMADVTFATIHVVNGKELGDTPQVFAQPTGKRSPRSGETLILFLELQNAEPATYAEITRIFSEGYWRAPGGLTTAMRLGIKLANDRIVDLNRGMPPSKRILGSLTCAVVNEENVVIAQAGPGIAFACAQSGAFEQLAPGPGTPAIGSSRTVDAIFTNFAWKTGDNFVLSGEGSCSGVSDTLVNTCMRKGDGRLVAGYVNANVKQGKMVGVAFSVAGAASAHATATPPPITVKEPQTEPAVNEAVEPQTASDRAAAPSHALADAGAAASTFIGGAAKSLQRTMGSFGQQLLPASAARSLAAERSRAATFGLAAVAILLPIIVALVVTILYFQFSGLAEKQQLQGQIRRQIEQAKSAPALDKWTNALSLIENYQARYPDETAALLDDQRLAQSQVDTINKVTRVAATAIVDLAATASPRRIAAASLGVYVLDPATNNAEYHVLNIQRNGVTGKPVPLTLAGGGIPAGAPIADVTWATASNGRWHAEGAVLYSKSALYEYSSATGQLIQLNLPSDPAGNPDTIVAGELYNSTAYLLDTGAGQIWRYTLQGNKLARGDAYFRIPNPQVKDCVDIAIDGAVYLVQKNGTVLKFYGRESKPFNINVGSLPQPIGQAIAIELSGPDQNTGNVYIGDASIGAIWQFTKTGDYVRQYRASNDEFVGMQDMSLDPTSNTMYVNTPNKLFSFKIG